MAYTLQDLLCGKGGTPTAPTAGVIGKLSYRQDVLAKGGLQKLQDAILELSRNYRFPDLEETGPATVLIPGQAEYPISYFTNLNADIVNLIPSFYMTYVTPQASVNGSGTNLTWKSVDTLELMINLTSYSEPAYFTRYGNNVIIAPTPQNANPIYMRYQVEHPFSDPPALTDPFLLPNDWTMIAEYYGALQFATDNRLLDYSESYHNKLFGDPQNPGKLGLIAAKITQIEGDSISMSRQLRPVIQRY